MTVTSLDATWAVKEKQINHSLYMIVSIDLYPCIYVNKAFAAIKHLLSIMHPECFSNEIASFKESYYLYNGRRFRLCQSIEDTVGDMDSCHYRMQLSLSYAAVTIMYSCHYHVQLSSYAAVTIMYSCYRMQLSLSYAAVTIACSCHYRGLLFYRIY